MTRVLIIEDDPMVQFIHKSYLEKISQTMTIYTSTTLKESRELLEQHEIDLILLDIHLEDGNGLQLLEELRRQKYDMDVILITASKESLLVKESLHLGVLDYLIKPFTFDRFEKRVALYHQKTTQLNQSEMNQEHIDAFLQGQRTLEEPEEEELEKGLTPETLQFVISTIQQLEQPFKIQDITDKTKLSHVSVRKYVAYLEKNGQLLSENIYLKVGRPYKVFYLNQKEEL
ncbi:response regulator [Vagococcus sp. DIV0080]|uniref:Transcriptional regulatory protein n=1 Tax=Candidatus Vagococcus giribetii TaxID=2230876 RepID=A0ABS3HPV9_9ENTE|nr:response regulator [Vagococcus sp. DIV0080]MBO0475777.1 response regulator [Vagococcus sp. DIV0080]